MSDPFLIEGPACISFSGGRTSAYMLRRILDAHGGTLPDDVHVLFANTGKERLETLDFVHECETRWSVPVVWVELRVLPTLLRFVSVYASGAPRFSQSSSYRVVSYETASRFGEPYDALILMREMLPNPILRFCTQELKIRPMKEVALTEFGFTHWTNVIGLRADEQRRVASAKEPTRQRWDHAMPLNDARITKRDVMGYWAGAPFDLQLEQHEGNCDVCMLKSQSKIERIIRKTPSLLDWWIAKEALGFGAGNDCRFRHDRPSYAAQVEAVRRTPMLPFYVDTEEDGDALSCVCTD